jgi:hypothetical protein
MNTDLQPDFQQFQRLCPAPARSASRARRTAFRPDAWRFTTNYCSTTSAALSIAVSRSAGQYWAKSAGADCAVPSTGTGRCTPWFREIPREFVRYLAEADIRQPRPRWLAELVHYEWAELAVDVMDTPSPAHDPAGDKLALPVALNPALLNLAYSWPVHRIGPNFRPRKRQLTYLVVYRDAHDDVQFSQINAVTGRLLTLLAVAPTCGEAAIRQIGTELQHPAPEQLLAHGAALLDDLHRQGIVLGTMA